MENRGVKSLSFVARNESDALNQRGEGVGAAMKLGPSIVSDADMYEPGTTEFFPVMSKVVGRNPDLIALSGLAQADAPKRRAAWAAWSRSSLRSRRRSGQC